MQGSLYGGTQGELVFITKLEVYNSQLRERITCFNLFQF